MKLRLRLLAALVALTALAPLARAHQSSVVYSTIVAPYSSAAKRFMKILIFLPFARQSHTQDLCSMHRLSKSGNCLILLDNYDRGSKKFTIRS